VLVCELAQPDCPEMFPILVEPICVFCVNLPAVTLELNVTFKLQIVFGIAIFVYLGFITLEYCCNSRVRETVLVKGGKGAIGRQDGFA
jgi:hypothetical protein